MVHRLDTEVVKVCWVNSAILFYNIRYWVKKNEQAKKKKNFHDGKYWTFNSVSSLVKVFPYFSEKQIRTALSKLRNMGLILTGNYNKKGYDKTLWYTISEDGYKLLRCSQEKTSPLA